MPESLHLTFDAGRTTQIYNGETCIPPSPFHQKNCIFAKMSQCKAFEGQLWNNPTTLEQVYPTLMQKSRTISL